MKLAKVKARANKTFLIQASFRIVTYDCQNILIVKATDFTLFLVCCNSTQLKDRQLLVHEFCLLCLSHSAASFSAITEVKAVNASAQLFAAAMKLLKVVFDSCTQSNWQLHNRGTAKNAKDVLDEICSELSKSILLHRNNEKVGDRFESRFHRLSHLVATKSSVTFLLQLATSNVKTANVAKLKNALRDELFDATLYLSHKSLHRQIYDLLNGEADDESRKRFDEVKKLFRCQYYKDCFLVTDAATN